MSHIHNEGVQMPVPAQRHMPPRRSGHTTVVTIGGERLCLTANQREDGTLREVFIRWGKHGTSAAGLADSYSIALSAGLQHQVPLADLIWCGLDLHFVPNGHTDDPDIPRVRSVIDYIARRLAIDWLSYDERVTLGILTLAERVEQARSWMTTDDASLVSASRAGSVESLN
jgi:ribonucleoside-diphosphate reductase alpha chain